MSPSLFVLIPALSCALLALLLASDAHRHRRRRARARAFLRALIGLGLGILAIGLLLLGVAIRNYFELSGETTIATLSFSEVGPQHFLATVTTADGHTQEFVLAGDQWQLDARVIGWRLPTLLAGVPPLYRVERISGRYLDLDQERDSERSVYALDAGNWPDLWLLRTRFPHLLPFVATHHGSAAYLPMLDDARFTVSLGGQGGLVARASDDATRERLRRTGW